MKMSSSVFLTVLPRKKGKKYLWNFMKKAWILTLLFIHCRIISTLYFDYVLGAGWGFVHQSKCGQFKIVIDDTKHVNRPKFKSMYVKFWRTWLKPVMKFSLGWFPRINSNSRLTFIDQPFNPISTGTGQNQPIYEYHVTTAGRNRVKDMHISQNVTRGGVFLFLTFAPGGRGQGIVFCCIAAWIQPDISGCQQDFLVVWRWNKLRIF